MIYKKHKILLDMEFEPCMHTLFICLQLW